jgi:hypothetical protein
MCKKYLVMLLLVTFIRLAQAQQQSTPLCPDLVNCKTNLYDKSSTSLGYQAALSYEEFSNNTFMGFAVGNGFTSNGKYNSFFGSLSGTYSEGSNNTLMGYQSGYFIFKGDRNVAIGARAGVNLEHADDNVLIGYGAGELGEIGNYNTFIGSYSGQYMQGNGNTALGYSSGWKAETAERSTFVGYTSGYVTKGSDNTFLGYETGYLNVDGFDNTFLGAGAGRSNTSGGNNTFVGKQAGLANTTGASNTFVGEGAGDQNTTGYGNVMVGTGAGDRNTEGDYNTYVGKDAGGTNIGERNVFLGYRAGHNANNSINKLAIGQSVNQFIPVYGDLGTRQLAINAYADNQLENIALSSRYKLLVNGGLLATANYTLSDDKFKDDIDEINAALSIVETLPVRVFSLINTDPTIEMPTGYVYGILTDGITDTNLMKEGYRGNKAIDNNGLTALLVKSVQELSTTNTLQQDRITQQQQQINELTLLVNEMRMLIGQRPASATSTQNEASDEAMKKTSLHVTPNPVKGSEQAIVHYSIAETVPAATLVVSTSSGLPLHTTSGLRGNGSIAVSTQGLVPGVYICTLQVGSSIIDTVRIVVE